MRPAEDYTYTENQRTETLDKLRRRRQDGDHDPRRRKLYGGQYGRRIAKNGRPLAGREKEKADEEFEREFRKRQTESPEQRAKREAEQEKDRAEARKFLHEIPRPVF